MKNLEFGFILINKPTGPTSHDIVDKMRKITGIKKIGHAGTLDPFASGLLILAVGRPATKKISYLVKKDKEYIATLKLGATSTTLDKDGQITPLQNPSLPTEEEIKKTLKSFVGKQEQIPPMFSAKKIGGQKLYKLARQGVEIDRPPTKINISKIEMLDYRKPLLKIKVSCSAGTYIRSLADDIGKELRCGAYLEELIRTKIGSFELKKALELKDLNQDNWSGFLFEL